MERDGEEVIRLLGPFQEGDLWEWLSTSSRMHATRTHLGVAERYEKPVKVVVV
jgi:hypothetical protein